MSLVRIFSQQLNTNFLKRLLWTAKWFMQNYIPCPTPSPFIPRAQSDILMMGGMGELPTEVHILYPKKSQLQNLMSAQCTPKNPTLTELHLRYVIVDLNWSKVQYQRKSLCFFSWPKKNPCVIHWCKNPFWPKFHT